MFRDSGIELNDVRDGQVAGEKPARTKNARHSTWPGFKAAKYQDGDEQQTQDRQILSADRVSPINIRLPVARIDHSSFHVKISREKYQARIITERACHQNGTGWRGPARLRRRHGPFCGELAETGVNDENQCAADNRAKAASKQYTC